MSREIKFRMWGRYSHTWKDASTIESPVHIDDGEPDTILSLNNFDGLGYTVEQYTGLEDKNGVEIFEGDILDDIHVVEWIEELVWDGGGSSHPGFWCRTWGMDDGYVDMDYHYGFGDVQVTGNIHENPKLLRGGADGGA